MIENVAAITVIEAPHEKNLLVLQRRPVEVEHSETAQRRGQQVLLQSTEVIPAMEHTLTVTTMESAASDFEKLVRRLPANQPMELNLTV